MIPTWDGNRGAIRRSLRPWRPGLRPADLRRAWSSATSEDETPGHCACGGGGQKTGVWLPWLRASAVPLEQKGAIRAGSDAPAVERLPLPGVTFAHIFRGKHVFDAWASSSGPPPILTTAPLSRSALLYLPAQINRKRLYQGETETADERLRAPEPQGPVELQEPAGAAPHASRPPVQPWLEQSPQNPGKLLSKAK